MYKKKVSSVSDLPSETPATSSEKNRAGIEMYLDLHVKCLLFLSEFNQSVNMSTDFINNPEHTISRKPIL